MKAEYRREDEKFIESQGRLLFLCFLKLIINGTGYFKQNEKGVATMCKLMEDMRNEAAHEAAHDKVKEKAILMLKNGKISFDEISIFFSELSDEEIEEIKSKIMQLA